MANIINVTPEKLKSTASSFQNTGASVRQTTTEMMSVISGISQAIWSGEAGSTYISKFKGLDGDVSRMCRMINKQVEHLNAIAQEYTSTEEQAASAAAVLKNNVIA